MVFDTERQRRVINSRGSLEYHGGEIFSDKAIATVTDSNEFIASKLLPAMMKKTGLDYDEFTEGFCLDQNAEMGARPFDYEMARVHFEQMARSSPRGIEFMLEHQIVYRLNDETVSDLWPQIVSQVNDAHYRDMYGHEEIYDYIDAMDIPEEYKVSRFSSTVFSFAHGRLPVRSVNFGYVIDDQEWFTVHDSIDISAQHQLIGRDLGEVVALMAMDSQCRSHFDPDHMDTLKRIMDMTGLNPGKKQINRLREKGL